jgi:hypothetical protein
MLVPPWLSNWSFPWETSIVSSSSSSWRSLKPPWYGFHWLLDLFRPQELELLLPSAVNVTVLNHLRNRGPKVGRQAHTIPTRGSQQDQINTWAIAQVKSSALTSLSIYTIRTILATQTLKLNISTCPCGKYCNGPRSTYKAPTSRIPPTATFWLFGIWSLRTVEVVNQRTMSLSPLPASLTGRNWHAKDGNVN